MRIPRLLKRPLVVIGMLACLGIGGIAITALRRDWKSIALLKTTNPTATAIMLERTGATSAPGIVWIPLDALPPSLLAAVIAAEDIHFTRHRGVDWQAFGRALKHNWRDGSRTLGASTITQQLAKNLFLSEERSYLRKMREAADAAMLEHVLDKRRILELYVNVAEWGPNVFGVEAACQFYWRHGASRLSPDQAVRLAAMLSSPRTVASPDLSVLSQEADRRAALIRVRMDWPHVRADVQNLLGRRDQTYPSARE